MQRPLPPWEKRKNESAEERARRLRKEKRLREARARRQAAKLQRLAERAEAEGVPLSEWENEFVSGVSARLQKHGSAYRDREKAPPGDLQSPLSLKQQGKAREIRRAVSQKNKAPRKIS